MANVWSGVTVDCLEPERVARFWSALLRRPSGDSPAGWVYLGEPGDAQPRLVFQPVSEPAAGKVRIHLDVAVDDIETAMARVVELGGQSTGERHDYDEGVVVVMADPEGHEFCLVQYFVTSSFTGVRLAYDTVAADYATHLPDTRAEAELDLAMVDAFAKAVTAGGDPRVLDAGCGAGRMSRYLAERGCLVQGVDLSPAMVGEARRIHPDLAFAVGSVTELPFPDRQFAGVLLWYSTIHTPPAGQARIFAEAARVLRPGGHLLVGFQAGAGTRDVSASYRRFGHEIELERYLCTPDQIASWVEAAGLRELSRLVRRAQGKERDDQAVVLAQAGQA